MRVSHVVLLLVALAALARASTSGIFSSTDSAEVVSTLAASMNKDGSFGSSIAETAAAVEAFAFAGHNLKDSKATCGFAAAGLAAAASPASYADAAYILTRLGCAEKTAIVAAKLESALTSSEVTSIFSAARALVALGKDASAAAAAVIALMDSEDGTFKETADSEFGTVQGAALALQTLALTATKTTPNLKSAVDSIADLLSLAEGPESGDYIAMYSLNELSADPLASTGYILDAAVRLEALVDGSVPAYTAETLGQFGQYFVVRKRSATAGSASALLKGVAAVGANKHFPLSVLTLVEGTVSKTQPLVRVRLSTYAGAPLAATVTASRVARDGADKAIITKQELTAVAAVAGDYEMNFGAAKPEPGFYVFDLAVSGGAKVPAIASVQHHVKVLAAIELGDCELAVAQELVGGTDTKPVACKAGQTVGTPVSADAAQRLRFGFSVRTAESKTSFAPHQVFALFTNAATGIVASFVVPRTASSAYALDLGIGAVAAEFSSHSGLWRLTVVVGDAFVSNPQLWEVASFNLKFASEPAKPALDVFAKKPDISHTFRLPEKRSTEVVSLAFTLVVLLPVVVLIGLLARLGANISNLPTGAGALAALGFHGSIGAILVLFFTFWLRLTMFETLSWLAVLGLAAIVFGHRLLSTHSAFRRESTKTE